MLIFVYWFGVIQGYDYSRLIHDSTYAHGWVGLREPDGVPEVNSG